MGEGVSTSLEKLVWAEGLAVLALATRPGDAEERRVGPHWGGRASGCSVQYRLKRAESTPCNVGRQGRRTMSDSAHHWRAVASC